MRLRLVLYMLILTTIPVLNASPEDANTDMSKIDETKLELDVGITSAYPAIQGNKAKYSEYRDIQDGTVGAYGSIYLDFSDPTGNFVKFNAVNIGYDDQYYRLDGGKRGKFKYSFFYNETPHNTTFNAITPYTGAGTSSLAYGGAAAPGANTSGWNSFNYSTKRKEYGAGAKIDILKPFYFDVSVSQENKTGIKPSGAEGAAAFGRVIELPQPVDYKTSYVKAEVGYAKQPYFLSFQYMFSQFTNNDQFLGFRNPFLTTQGNVDVLTLPPDNTSHKLGFAGTVKLPYNTRLNTNLAYTMMKSDQNLLTSIWDTNALVPVTLTRSAFHGDVRTQAYDFVLTAHPLSFLEGKIYYKYYNRDNRSDIIAATAGGTTIVNNLFQYHNQRYGAEVDFRLRKDLHLLAGYKHADLDRRRDDIATNQDDIYSAELKWSPMKMGTLKLGYERLTRAASFQAVGLTGDDLVGYWVRRFDAAPKITDAYKATMVLSPVDELNINIGYKYKKTSYTDTTLGLQNDERNIFNFDVDYSIGESARVFGYFDWDERKWTQFERRYASGGSPNPFGPVQNAANFNWQSDQCDKTYDLGAALELYVIPRKLTVRLSADYLQSHGSNDFTYFSNAALTGGRNNDNIDVGNWGSYKKEFYMVKFLYNLSATVSLTAGYAYEKYTTSDAQYDGYVYTLGNPPNTYLTGAYANPDYKANVVFIGINYKFR